MSYSQRIKSEICTAKFHCTNCEVAMLYGFLLFNRGITENALVVTTDSRAVTSYISESLAAVSGAIVTVTAPDIRQNKRRQFSVCVADKNDISCVLHKCYDNAVLDKHQIVQEAIKKDCCKQAFLRGVFLSCGTVSNPDVEYHLEFATAHKVLCDEVCSLLHEQGFEIKSSYRASTGIHTAYIKDSEMLADILTYLGAVKASLDLINLKIEKELRNNVNRVTNCETANIGKTVNAALKQIDKIKKLKNSSEYLSINSQLKEAAELRLANPDLSLRELVEISGGKISRSGLNHRLNKLCELADQIKI